MFYVFLQAHYLFASPSIPDQRRPRMETDFPDQARTAECRAYGFCVTPPIAISGTWTKEKWSTYLQKIRKDVETGEAPIELYFHGLEILGVRHAPEWV